MFLSRWSVRRPIAMTAFIIVLVMIGASLYPRLSIDLLPNMEIPTVLVRCEYQGASPAEIEVEVIKRIEDAVSSLDGIMLCLKAKSFPCCVPPLRRESMQEHAQF
ncbi:MAG: efflux RND transporter permease subunit [Lentisphaeria bacterium]|nr:efflux RND transporter permease subunit [Lentisphaeria bacterium]